MAGTPDPLLTIVADDLTGACDTGALFAGKFPVPVAIWPDPPRPAPVRLVDTESRALDTREAARRAAAAAAAAPAPRWFKKIDSTLRGRVGAEVSALLRATGLDTALVAPAFPARGRTVVERVLLVDGVPVTETAVARDPEFPLGSSASVVDVLRRDLDRSIAWVPLDQVRAGGDALAARLGRLRGTVVVADAETDDDLLALADAALGLDPAPLLVGAAGLARAVAARLGLLTGPVRPPRGRRWLVVAGSRHPATRRQVEACRAAGIAVLPAPEADEPDRGAVAARLAAEARQRLDAEAFDLVVVTGGQTALALVQALEADAFDLLGAPAPGLALAELRGPRGEALPVITKAGGFGEPDLLVELWEAAR
jgi:uncharacterized protein YgbK (DUF1537 family)